MSFIAMAYHYVECRPVVGVDFLLFVLAFELFLIGSEIGVYSDAYNFN